ALHGVEASWEVGSTALARALGTAGPPIVVAVAGDSIEDLRLGAERIRERLAERPELWNVQSSFEGAPPEMRIELKRTMADGLGVDLETLGAVLETSLDGLRATTLTMGDEERDVMLRLPQVDPDALLELPLQTRSGRRLTVRDDARIVET